MGKMVGGRNNDEGMRKSAHRGRGKKTPNAGGEGFIRNYLHLDNAKHLEPPSPRRCVTDAAAFGGGGGSGSSCVHLQQCQQKITAGLFPRLITRQCSVTASLGSRLKERRKHLKKN